MLRSIFVGRLCCLKLLLALSAARVAFSNFANGPDVSDNTPTDAGNTLKYLRKLE